MYSKRKIIIERIVLGFLTTGFFVIIIYQLNRPDPSGAKKNNTIPLNAYDRQFLLTETQYEFKPYQGVVTLEPDRSVSLGNRNQKRILDGMSLQEVADFRLQQIDRYRILNFFHPRYHPLRYYHREIYQQITPGAHWTRSAPYFIANPYLLIVFTQAHSVTALNIHCPNSEITYRNGVIEEVHRGKEALCWFNKIFQGEPECNGYLWPIMVNAWDAGFPYIHVDPAECLNVEPSTSATHITRSIYSCRYFYHQGKGGNNLSPGSPDAYIRLTTPDVETVVPVRLWRSRPTSPQQKSDLVYRLIIVP
jgi:hypothetical protein